MSGLELPLSLLDRLARPASGPVALDDATLLRLERSLRRVEPDALFRRRLRGHVVNRYVAVREGLLVEPHPSKRMGTLGRSVLYASLAVALSVSAAGAAAQDSIPGDVLYGVKLQLEEARMRIAPASVRGELAEMALAERVSELEQLAAAGAWDLVPAAAARLTEARQELMELGPQAGPGAGQGERGAAEVLESVLAEAPPAARDGLQRALRKVGPPPGKRDGARPQGAVDAPRNPAAGERGRGSSGAGAAPGAANGADSRAEEKGKPQGPPAQPGDRGRGPANSPKD